MLVEVTAYRPLRARNAPPLAFLITAIGASFVLSEFIGAFTNRRQLGVPALLPTAPIFSIGEWSVTPIQLSTIVVAVVMLIGLDTFVRKTRFGRGIRAVAQDQNTAALMGVNKNRVILLVFLLGGLMAGVAAVFADMKIGNTRYNVGFLLGLKAFAAAVLGGIGNLRGAALGGVLLGLTDEVQWDMGFRLLLLMFAGVTLGGLGTAYGALVGSLVVGIFVQMSTLIIPNDVKYVGGLLLLIVILIIRPQGILGARVRVG
jgi:branched-subunit amino acid ABC-type transport system permease component